MDTSSVSSSFPCSWINPFLNSQAERYKRHFCDVYGRAIRSEADFRKNLAEVLERPEIILIWSFCAHRAAILSLCREYGVNVVWWEDGFLPHYYTLHFDPLGFCWESSLPRMIFRKCTDEQRERANFARRMWQIKPNKELPSSITKPYVLWPLQIIGDMVNEWDLDLKDWTEPLQHFRAALPSNIQLIIKDHPNATAADVVGIDTLLTQCSNTVRFSFDVDLTTLLRECNAVAGVNSSVLYEARLIHRKPVYAYGRSWFTNHDQLFMPLTHRSLPLLPRQDWIENPMTIRTEWLDDYTDWFLAQLLGRQLDSRIASCNSRHLHEKIRRLSYDSFVEHGEAVFDA